MFANRLKQLWAEDRPAANGWLSIASPFVAEIMAAQGYDTLTIDVQHGALDYSAMLVMLQAMRGSHVTPLVRVPWREPGIVMKALDAGAMGIICPMINNAVEAAEFASYMRYPPRGTRSYGPTRATVAYGGYGLAANDEVLAIAMIETRDGVENVEAIAATEGIDGIYIGPSDLTLGTTQGRLPPGFDRDEPEIVDLIKHVLAAAKAKGIRAGLHCGSPDYAAMAIKWGFDLTTVGGDTTLLAKAAATAVGRWRELTGAGCMAR
ncbi:aldolase/citrate lyase family protein [Jiella sp. MQZ9-1]|uniref:2,4-dihydroxyhept-2-ene-1,7-dioic acid aldolase n=1 Tax=Jiella flava TaxID=2816857 RepID=A0A939JRL0_9HYPH|nr:aldolase/citrate lyase family protein [Jiella flava]MBO0662013.1 2,4-dihydroxyhept-2-ene-1,7-dioic acid aldolase [Jiella flava]MCD2470660.1 aldolase/citrate lyase family protein [Jiella flava]